MTKPLPSKEEIERMVEGLDWATAASIRSAYNQALIGTVQRVVMPEKFDPDAPVIVVEEGQ